MFRYTLMLDMAEVFDGQNGPAAAVVVGPFDTIQAARDWANKSLPDDARVTIEPIFTPV